MDFFHKVLKVCELYPFKSLALAFIFAFIGAMLVQL